MVANPVRAASSKAERRRVSDPTSNPRTARFPSSGRIWHTGKKTRRPEAGIGVPRPSNCQTR